jgi:hypothetical protein
VFNLCLVASPGQVQGLPYDVLYTDATISLNDLLQKLSLWEIGEDNFLRAAFDLHCNESRHSVSKLYS